MKKVILSLVAVVCLSACRNISKPFSYGKEVDTMPLSYMHINKNSIYYDSLSEYRLINGILIPKYYDIEDSLSLDLNFDGIIDKILILSPVSIGNSIYYKLDSAPQRLLIEINSIKGKMKIRNIYNNLLSSTGGMISNYYGIYNTKEGFEIEHRAGSRFTWVYKNEYTTKYPDSIYLISITKECGLDLNKRQFQYHFDKYSVKNLNINDSIKSNCSCDKSWDELEAISEKGSN